MKHLYQAEVLVPSPVPPHLIMFPDDLEASKTVKAKSVYKAQKSARATSLLISTSACDSFATAPSGHSAGARKLVGTLSNSDISNSAICLVRCPETVCRLALDDPAKLQHPPAVDADSREVTMESEPANLPHEGNLQDLRLRRNRKLAEYLKLDDIVKPRDPPWWPYWRAIEIQLAMNARRIPEDAKDARIIIRCEMPLSMDKDCFDCVQSGKFINCVTRL